MKTIWKKAVSRRGETLAGILVAILIIAVSAALFATMYSASMNINLAARREDEEFYEAVGFLEKMETAEGTSSSKGEVHYKSANSEQDVEVEFLTQSGLTVYRESAS